MRLYGCIIVDLSDRASYIKTLVTTCLLPTKERRFFRVRRDAILLRGIWCRCAYVWLRPAERIRSRSTMQVVSL